MSLIFYVGKLRFGLSNLPEVIKWEAKLRHRPFCSRLTLQKHNTLRFYDSGLDSLWFNSLSFGSRLWFCSTLTGWLQSLPVTCFCPHSPRLSGPCKCTPHLTLLVRELRKPPASPFSRGVRHAQLADLVICHCGYKHSLPYLPPVI